MRWRSSSEHEGEKCCNNPGMGTKALPEHVDSAAMFMSATIKLSNNFHASAKDSKIHNVSSTRARLRWWTLLKSISTYMETRRWRRIHTPAVATATAKPYIPHTCCRQDHIPSQHTGLPGRDMLVVSTHTHTQRYNAHALDSPCLGGALLADWMQNSDLYSFRVLYLYFIYMYVYVCLGSA